MLSDKSSSRPHDIDAHVQSRSIGGSGWLNCVTVFNEINNIPSADNEIELQYSTCLIEVDWRVRIDTR